MCQTNKPDDGFVRGAIEFVYSLGLVDFSVAFDMHIHLHMSAELCCVHGACSMRLFIHKNRRNAEQHAP